MSTIDSKKAGLKKADYEQLSNFRFQLRKFLRDSEDICRASEVTPLQYQLLLHVMGAPNRDWLTIGELAERLQAKHHGVVALIDRCEKLGLIERRAIKEDRRKVAIHLLPEGVRLLNHLAELHQKELRLLREVLLHTNEND